MGLILYVQRRTGCRNGITESCSTKAELDCVPAISKLSLSPGMTLTCFTANAALLSPYVWLQGHTLAVSKRLDLFRYASTAYAMWKREKQEHPANMSTQQLSTQPSWDRLWCLCERRKVSVQADTTAARYSKKVQRYQSVGGRQTQGLRTQIGGEPQLYLGSNTKPGRKSKEGGEGGSYRRGEM